MTPAKAILSEPESLARPKSDSGSRNDITFLLVFTLMAAGLIATGTYYYRRYEANFRVGVEQQLLSIADLKVSELVQYRKERLGDGGILFKNATISVLVRRLLDQPEDADAQSQLRMWFAKFLDISDYDLIRLLDAPGVTRLSTSAGAPPLSTAALQRFPEILRAGQVILQDFHRNEHDGRIYLDVVVPIFDPQEVSRPLAVLNLRIDPEHYLFSFIRRWPTPSQTAETLLVRRDGNDVLYLNELKFRNYAALALRFPLTRTEIPAVKAVLGQTGIVEGTDYRGVPVVAALRAIPDSPWHLVARMDIAEVYAPMRERLWEVVGTIGLLIFGAGAGLGLIWRQQRVNFFRQRFEAEAALRESDRFLQESQAAAGIGSYALDLADGSWRSSPELDEIFGLDGGAVHSFEIWTDLVHPDWRQVMTDHFAVDVLRKHARFDKEYQIIRLNDGAERWVHGLGKLELDARHRPIRLIGTIQDITGLKKIEAVLRRSEASLQAILRSTADGVLAVNNENLLLAANDRFVEMWNIPPALVASRDDTVMLQHILDQQVDTQGFLRKVHAVYRSTDDSFDTLQFKDGRVFERLSRPLLEEGRVEGRVWTFRDVTERKRQEQALKESEVKFRTMADFTYDWEYWLTPDLHFYYMSPACERVTGYRAEEFQRDPNLFVAITHPEDRPALVRHLAESTSDDLCAQQMEFRIITRSGEERWIAHTCQAVHSDTGVYLGRRASNRDITARKRALQELQDSLQEKEALLKEVHHRVKNNLQVITSLLRLQAAQIEHPITQMVLRDMQSRIRSMALLHETLYRSGNFARIDLGNYLRDLCGHLFRSIGTTAGAVALQVDVAAVVVEMDVAVSCGLIVNELASNCLKHGFPAGRKGEIRVELHSLNDGAQLRLRVTDNGVGLPEDFEQKQANSMGMQLVEDLAGQLEGRLVIGTGPGASFDVIFTPA